FKQVRTENTLTYSALATGELGIGRNHWLRGTLFYTRATDKRFIEDAGFLRENGRTVERTTLEWEERALWTLQLTGDHYLRDLADVGVDWGITFANAERIKPDTRFYEYEQATLGNFVFADERSGNLRQWEDLKDDAWDIFVNADLPVAISDSLFTTFKTGVKWFRKDRDSSLRKLRYNAAFPSANDFNRVRRQDIEGVFSDDNIGRRKWELEESTQFTDSYTASEEIRGVFLQSESEIGDSLRLMVGARYEESDQGTETRAVSGGTPVASSVTGGFLLPAATLTWSFRDNHQLRVAWSQTVNRPDIREISPAPYLDPETRFEYIGNPDLKIAEITNYDLRWEWYFHEQDNLQLAVFYKDIAQPIEETLLLKGSSVQRSYQNAEGAELYGVEFAIQQSLGFLGELGRDFAYKANGTIIASDVAVNPSAINQTNPSRSLQGQSDWVANVQLSYENLVWDSQFSLAFNMAGERIFDVGVNGLDDSFEQGVPLLDFNYRQGFEFLGGPMALQFKVRNILDPSYEITRGEIVEREFNRGRTFSVSIEREF
ncbi:MAG: TonB-dependent receptor, partial [Hyphomicrobiaceae bacterium]